MNSESSRRVISAVELGKAYRQYPSRAAMLSSILLGRSSYQSHWVFRGISFELHAGEAIGVVGKNGAGKSTLLKLLSGLQQPTEGRLEISGRVAFILELGIGLHPDFTGEENARQMALIQGLSQSEVDALIPQIRAFAEIGDYFDQPVRTYSSGMQMRLAFSVATVQRPDVLIVDEAMAVGDAYFQHKCFERIHEMRDAGSAILLVSHDPAAVRSICSRAILIHEGRAVCDGPAAEVLERYNALLSPEIDGVHQHGEGMRSGNGRVVIESVTVSQNNAQSHALKSGQPVVIELCLRAAEQVSDLTVGILIKDRLGNDVYGTNTAHHALPLSAKPGERLRVQWDVDQFCLGPGHYSLTVAAHSGLNHQAGNYDWWDRAHTFQVLPPNGPAFIGSTALGVRVDCFRMGSVGIK